MASNEINTQQRKGEVIVTPNKIKQSEKKDKHSTEPKLYKPIAVNINNNIPSLMYQTYYPINMNFKQEQLEQYNAYRSLYMNNKQYEENIASIPLLSSSSTPFMFHNIVLPQLKVANTPKPCCSCTKTKCLKKYCECYSKGRLCKDCRCEGCGNKGSTNSNIRPTVDTVICTCTKSNCSKKYCDCFKAGSRCTERCRCLNCLNTLSTTSPPQEKLSPTNKSRKSTKSSSVVNVASNDDDDEFVIQRISVFICKEGSKIEYLNMEKEDIALLGNKRRRSEEEN